MNYFLNLYILVYGYFTNRTINFTLMDEYDSDDFLIIHNGNQYYVNFSTFCSRLPHIMNYYIVDRDCFEVNDGYSEKSFSAFIYLCCGDRYTIDFDDVPEVLEICKSWGADSLFEYINAQFSELIRQYKSDNKIAANSNYYQKHMGFCIDTAIEKYKISEIPLTTLLWYLNEKKEQLDFEDWKEIISKLELINPFGARLAFNMIPSESIAESIKTLLK